MTLLLSDGHGGLSPHQLPLRTGESWFAVIADLNGDGKPDIVASHHEKNEMTVLLGDGRGGFTEAAGSPFDFGVALFHLIATDVDRDGRMDIIGTSGNTVRVLLGDGHGAFKSTASIQVGAGAWRIAAADLNGDGMIDVVTSNSDSNDLTVLLGTRSHV